MPAVLQACVDVSVRVRGCVTAYTRVRVCTFITRDCERDRAYPVRACVHMCGSLSAHVCMSVHTCVPSGEPSHRCPHRASAARLLQIPSPLLSEPLAFRRGRPRSEVSLRPAAGKQRSGVTPASVRPRRMWDVWLVSDSAGKTVPGPPGPYEPVGRLVCSFPVFPFWQ